VASQQQRLDFRDLAAATRDSCRLLLSFLRDLVKRPAIGIEGSFLATQHLPALDDDVQVLRV
jgi:hypothetical protein